MGNEYCKQIRLVLPNELAEQLEQHCKKSNESKSGFIKNAIIEKIEREQ